MKATTIFMSLGVALIIFTLVPRAQAAELDVKVTNSTHGIYFTPLLVTAHDVSTRLFEPGSAATASLRLMAECGDISSLLADVGGADSDTVANPASGLLAPGASTLAAVDTGATGNTHLSIVGMLLPTNDGFVGLDSIKIPSSPGTYTYYLNGYDAGTEANTELLDTSGCAPGMAGIPAAPGGDAGSGGSGLAGNDSNSTVHVHRGNLGDTNPVGGRSDLDSTIHRWQNPIAKVTLTVK